MNNASKFALVTGIVLVLAFAVNLTHVGNQATAQETSPFPSREKVISVTGTATTSVQPDLLVIQFGVETQEKTASLALESNSQMMNAVVDAIRAVGISEDDISTSRFNISPVYEGYEENKRYKQELVGYMVTNTIMVKTTSLDSAADIIDSSVAVGANRVDSVYFTLSPEKQITVKDDLLGKAVINAKTKAENALRPLNHKIIGVKSVSLSEFGIPYPQPMYRGYGDVAMESSFAKSTPVFSSEQDVSTTANIIFLIGTT